MSTIKCPECKLVSWASEYSCKRCAFVFQPFDTAAEPRPMPTVAATAEGFNEFPHIETSLPVPKTLPPRDAEWGLPPRTAPTYSRQPAPPAKQKIGLAVFSMIAGIVGMPPISSFGMLIVGGVLSIVFGAAGFIAGVVLVFALTPIALVTGISALRRANRSAEYGGKGFAIAGIATSSLGLLILPIIGAIAIPNLLAARRAANEGAALSTIRKLAGAETTFMTTRGSSQCGDLDALAGASLIEKTTAKGESGGYRFMILKQPSGGCEIHATPMSESMGNRSFFYQTSEGVIRATTDKTRQAGRNDPAINDGSSTDDTPARIASQKSR